MREERREGRRGTYSMILEVCGHELSGRVRAHVFNYNIMPGRA